MYAIMVHPVTLQPGYRVDGVIINKVHPDGTFDAHGGVWLGRGCNQADVVLYDDDGNPIDPAMLSPPISETEKLRQQLAMQDAVLQELLFSIIPMMIGGEL